MKQFITLALLAMLILTAGAAHAQEFEFNVLTDSDAASFVVESDGNLDGDDQFDVIVGCASGCDDDNHGVVYIFLGKSISDSTLDLSRADYVIKGSAVDEHFGSDVGFLNDEDGDSFDEIIVGFGKIQEYEVFLSSELQSHVNTVVIHDTENARHSIHVSVGASTSDCSLNPNVQVFNASHFGVLTLLAASVFILKALRIAINHTDSQFKTSRNKD